MLEKIKPQIIGRHLELRERLFRLIVIIGLGITVIGLVETVFFMELKQAIAPLGLLLIALIFVMILTFKFGQMEIAAMILSVVLSTIVFPEMFLYSGGIKGGASSFFTLSIFYVVVMFSGKKLIFFLGLNVIFDIITYLYSYYHPEAVVIIESEMMAHIDSFFGFIIVGIAVGVFMKFQMQMYKEEREVVFSQKKELEEINDSRNNFFTSMTHEIRTPVNTVIGSNEMILRQSDDEEIRQFANNSKAAGKMLLNLVNDILDLSKIEMHMMEIVSVEYETKDLFRDLIEIVSVSANEKNLKFICNIDENVPTTLLGDEKRIQQIIINLLSNAIKYTEKGSVNFTVTTEKIDDKHINLKVSVADTGIGIKKEDIAVLYDSFRRIDQARNIKVEGSGLGLSITKQLIDLMGGEITVDSIYTKGSIFTVVLKQEVVDPTPIGDIWEKISINVSSKEYYKQLFEAPEARVLVVDDNDMNSLVISKLLEKTKVKIDVANSGADAVKKTKEKYYHVILMDYMMPELNGVETVRKIRNQRNGLCRESAVIMISANEISEVKDLAENDIFEGFLEKPVQPDKLERELLRFIPDEIVEYRKGDEQIFSMESDRVASVRKRKKVYVTTDCICDLPEEVLQNYDIKVMYLYVETEKGRFADIKEIDSDNLSELVSDEKTYATSVAVCEYEDFFAEALTEAEEVIHVSMASKSGRCYDVAVAAAGSFDHVRVIDSGQISCGQGLVTLHAARMAMGGSSVSEIMESVNQIFKKVHTRFVLPHVKLYSKRGYINRLFGKVIDFVGLKPVLSTYQGKMRIVGMVTGTAENAWTNFIRMQFINKKKIDKRIVIITYVGCSAQEREFIKREVLKQVAFEKVIMQKASLSSAVSSGSHAIGISYYTAD